MDAAQKGCQVEGIETGVFTGKYITGVPKGYFEHLSALRNGKKLKSAAAAAGLTEVNTSEPSDDPVVVTNSGPVNGTGPEYREDIRFVVATAADILCSVFRVTNMSCLPASTTLRAKTRTTIGSLIVGDAEDMQNRERDSGSVSLF